MNIVVDTNIVFSAILSSKGKIHDLILNSDEEFKFYAPTFMLKELEIHHNKLKRISRLDDSDITFIKRAIFHSIQFIDVEIIREENWKKGYKLASDIDGKDTPFVALAIDIKGKLWTGDKKLSNGLKSKNVDWVVTTNSLFEQRKN